MLSPVQISTDEGTVNLDIASGKKLEVLFGQVRTEQLRKHWKGKINEMWEIGKADGQAHVKIKADEEIDGDQTQKQGECQQQVKGCSI